MRAVLAECCRLPRLSSAFRVGNKKTIKAANVGSFQGFDHVRKGRELDRKFRGGQFKKFGTLGVLGSQAVENHRTIWNLKREIFFSGSGAGWSIMGVKVKDVPIAAERSGTAIGIISLSNLWFSLFDSSFFSVPAEWFYLLPSAHGAHGVEWL